MGYTNTDPYSLVFRASGEELAIGTETDTADVEIACFTARVVCEDAATVDIS